MAIWLSGEVQGSGVVRYRIRNMEYGITTNKSLNGWMHQFVRLVE